MRVHRSFVANVNNIKRFDSKEKKLYFSEKTYCLVSRKNVIPLKNILKEGFVEM
ncbi:LytTR family transcriptional regulator DNA-binding domain-containing protein [Ligilactobacillus salivarius]|uniref:LytTR family transcriptional regulator DNA-binding domain-containing protein n=1 Tax=Ligilactobacillus salivarius TaxID=1624 RepID=UPI000AE1062C|nr:LytTR family transcriptional regulator DNA-binding domain-containing protein [Ligilactobacillus salivarius]MDE1499250.1 LytTR family transcriptional regulator DNA-binding domain-containing protein [Ligilactobacillus salivarius]MDE1523585.1 LytTR family transcriptional regulator DNA-binding domain-containing protein [Ligilactobacillus salivarius]MDE1526042.1 LytTR family transcriptional regulator DNA-binding domain-containing protein [Ligilactobacillus salivarius]